MAKSGPNVTKLIIAKMTRDINPKSFGDGVGEILSWKDPAKLKARVEAATKWVQQALAVVKTAPDNPYKDDEEIAGALLKNLEDRKNKKADS